jgi:hypothetical protein
MDIYYHSGESTYHFLSQHQALQFISEFFFYFVAPNYRLPSGCLQASPTYLANSDGFKPKKNRKTIMNLLAAHI